MILFAAVLAVALVIAPTAFAADTTGIPNGGTITDNNVGAGADVAVNKSSVVYISTVDNGTVKVFKNSTGTFAQDVSITNSTCTASGKPRLTAIDFAGFEDSPVVAVATETQWIDIYMMDTTGSYRTQASINVNLFAMDSATGNLQYTINALDVVANDSLVVVTYAVAGIRDTGAFMDSASIVTYVYRIIGGRLYVNPKADSIVLGRQVWATDLQSGFSVVRDGKNDSTAFVYILANITSDSAAGIGTSDSNVAMTSRDTGVNLWTIAVHGTPKLQDTVYMIGRHRLGGRASASFPNFTDVAMAIDQYSSSDTVDRVSVLAAAVGAAGGSDTLTLWELGGDSSQKQALPYAHLIVADTYTELDTGLRGKPIVTGAPGTISFGRTGATLLLVFEQANTAGATHLYTATASLSRTLGGGPGVASSASGISWSPDTIGLNTGYTQNNPVVGASLSMLAEELSQFLVSSTLHTSGYNDNTNQVFYLTLGGSSDTKKKDSAVCVMDRLFGKTSLAKAVFPSFKSFRDTLLGTNFGRKIVSLYYSI